MDHEPVKVIILITDALCGRLKWRARHHTPALVVAITDNINEVVVALEQLPGPIPPLDPPTSLTTEMCEIFDNFCICHWDNFSDKSKCFDCGDFAYNREIKDNIGADAIIVPTLMDNIPMRYYGDSNKFWTELVKILRPTIFDLDLQIKGSMYTKGPLANMSRFLQKLEHCSGENAEKIYNRLKHSKLKIKGFRIDPNSHEVVTVIVLSFTGHLGNLAAYHADEILKLDNIDALTVYVRVSFRNEDLEGIYLYSLIKLDHFDKPLHEDTHEFNSSNSYWKDDISVNSAAYLYIGGLKVGALRADLMTNW
jgi:hypothetical protein